jgi:hypothetical protein
LGPFLTLRIILIAGSDENWTHASALRKQGPGAVKDFLRGGWKDVHEDKVWWELSEEVEQERVKRVEGLSVLAKSMDGLRM